MEVDSDDEAENLDYKEMNATYYYIATLTLFAVECFLGALLLDVELVFNFVSAIACSSLGFAFPSFFFLTAEKKYPRDDLIEKNGNMRIVARVHQIAAFIVFTLCMFEAIYGLTGGLDGVCCSF